MLSWQIHLKGDPLPWLLEEESPGVRYLVLRDVLDLPKEDIKLKKARKIAHTSGPIAHILDNLEEPGYWMEPGPGYNPKYRSTVWAMILLAQLGASIEDDLRIERATGYLMEHALTSYGQFSASGTPSSTADCLQGNLCWALLELGVDASQLEKAFDWMARSVTGEGIAPMEDRQAPIRYYAGKCGPDFMCGSNNKLPCAWGAVKVMLAFGRLPVSMRTPLVERAIQRGVDFLLGVDPATADYPTGYASKPSGNWWKFGFPVFYVTDLLQLVEAFGRLGYGQDPRLQNVIQLICDKQDEQGRWSMEYDYTGKTWVDFGPKKAPNKWVTLRALRTLKILSSPKPVYP